MRARVTGVVAAFRCTGDACPNTCCQGWNMQVDEATVAKYRTEAPELLDIVEPKSDIDGVSYIIRRDATTDRCTQYEAGWCGVHRTRGETMLGDACHFFPRIVREAAGELNISASLSCPEIARLSLLADDAGVDFSAHLTEVDRRPVLVRNVTPDGMSADAVWAVHQAFLALVAQAQTPAQAVLHLYSAAQSLEAFDVAQWEAMAPMAIKFAASRVPAAEEQPADTLNLLLAFAGLLEAAKKHTNPNYRTRAEWAAELLAAPLRWEPTAVDTTDATLARLAAIPARAEMQADWLHPLLLRWLQAQISAAFFPFAGFGSTLANRAAILGIRLATLQLMLLARAGHEETPPTPEMVADEAHWLARFMDHLAAPELSEKIYSETGWLRGPRLRALLEAMGL